MAISNEGVVFLNEALAGVRQFFQKVGGVNIALLFGIGTAVIIYLIFKHIAEGT